MKLLFFNATDYCYIGYLRVKQYNIKRTKPTLSCMLNILRCIHDAM